MSQFPPTAWTAVFGMGDDDPKRAEAARERIINDYHDPIFAFIRIQVRSEHDAEDLTQEFIKDLLEKPKSMANADPEKGRFRDYLRGAIRNFLRRQWAKEKRRQDGPNGGGKSLDSLAEGSGPIEVPADCEASDEAFHRTWKQNVVRMALEVLCDELTRTGRRGQWDVFSRLMLTDGDRPTYQAVADELSVTISLVTNRLHSAKQRYRRAVREVVAATLRDPGEVDDELRALIGAFQGVSHG